MKLLFISCITILFIIYIGSASALSCNHQWHCLPVTEKYGFVDCVNNECVCDHAKGFSGAATLDDKCHCEAPKDIFFRQFHHYCLDFDESLGCLAGEEKEAVLQHKATTIYESLLWPTPQYIMGGLIAGDNSLMENFFAVNAKGRVDPVGTFSDFEGVVEYFYGTVWQGFSRVVGVDIRKAVIQGNEVAVRVNLLIDYYNQDQTQITHSQNLTQTGILTFNDNNLVEKIELIIHNLGKLSNPTSPPGLQTIGTACFLIMDQAGCGAEHDPDGFYTDMNDCVAYMSGLPHGTWADVPDDSVICRYYHSLLAIARPHQHCSHSGKTGGGKCVISSYDSYYDQEY